MKNVINKMTMTFPSRSSNEGFARTAAAAFVAQLDPTVDELSDIKTAVSEAVTNCIVHAYDDTQDGIISIDTKIVGNVLHIAIADNGKGIDDISKARQPFFTTKRGDDKRSGLGFTVMETFMDTLEVTPNGEKGLMVKMSKAINSHIRSK